MNSQDGLRVSGVATLRLLSLQGQLHYIGKACDSFIKEQLFVGTEQGMAEFPTKESKRLAGNSLLRHRGRCYVVFYLMCPSPVIQQDTSGRVCNFVFIKASREQMMGGEWVKKVTEKC